MAKAVFGIVSSESQASAIVDDLRVAGFSKDDISAIFPDRGGARDFGPEKTKVTEGAATGAGAGAALGGVLGWLAGIGTLTIPGVGPLIAAGPIAGMLSGAAIGAATGGITGALVGHGMPDMEARRFEGKVKSGHILLAAITDDRDQAMRATQIFVRHRAEDVTDTGAPQEAGARYIATS